MAMTDAEILAVLARHGITLDACDVPHMRDALGRGLIMQENALRRDFDPVAFLRACETIVMRELAERGLIGTA
jgi:hypothetical protein